MSFLPFGLLQACSAKIRTWGSVWSTISVDHVDHSRESWARRLVAKPILANPLSLDTGELTLPCNDRNDRKDRKDRNGSRLISLME